MEIKSYQNSKKNLMIINPYKEGVNTVPKKFSSTVNFENGSMIRIHKNKILYYTPKQRSHRNRRIIAGLTSLGIAATLVGVFSPVIVQSFQKLLTNIEVKSRPEQKELIEHLIPDILNPSETIGDQKEKFLDLSESALTSVTNLTSKVNNIFSKYSDIEGSLTPAFVIINYENQIPKSFKLFCDLDNENFICFDYMISDIENFENLTESNDIEVTNVINGLINSLNNRDLIDMPTLGKKLKINDNENYVTDIIIETEATSWNDLTQTYNLEDFYVFKAYYAKDTTLIQKNIRILKSDAEKLESFDSNNINCLYDIYLNDPTKFEKESDIELGANSISTILLSAKNMAKNKVDNFEQ